MNTATKLGLLVISSVFYLVSQAAAVYNLFNLGRHLISAENYQYFRLRAFATWEKLVAM